MNNERNILILVPHWNSPVTNYTISSLSKDKNNNIYILDFNEKEANSDIKSIPVEVIKSNISIKYDENRAFNQKESKQLLLQIKDIIKTKNINYILSGKNRYERFLSENKNKIKNIQIFVPDIEIVKICEDKKNTYDFLKKNKIDTPNYYTKKETINNITQKYFLKPRKENSNNKGNLSQNIEEIKKIKNKEIILCEELIYPEINNTIYVKQGKIILSKAYIMYEKYDLDKRRIPINDKRIEEYSKKIIDVFLKKFNNEKVDGIYNLDFMRKKDKEIYVINEINIGRLSAGHYCFLEQEKNIPQILITSR